MRLDKSFTSFWFSVCSFQNERWKPESGNRCPAVVLFVTVLAVSGIVQTSCSACQGPSDRHAATLQRIEAFKRAEALKRAQAPSDPAPVCPGSPVASAKLPAQGSHRVILSWSPSKAADAKHSAAIGYCIYRGTKHKDPSPELLNSKPFSGTSCIDDLVVNSQKYYYVVRAISLQGDTSDPSNETPAAIPAGPLSKAPVSSAPLCRQPPATP